MPYDSGLTDRILVKLVRHQQKTDNEIADMFHISKQAVSARRMRLGLVRKPVSREVSEALATRWEIYSVQGKESHHNRHSAKSLKVWLRRQLGDQKLSEEQLRLAERWERRLREENVVICYDPDTPDGWYYRPRQASDGRRVIDWPKGLPFPSERFKRALDLPPEPAKESC